MKQTNLKELRISDLSFVFWIRLTDDTLKKMKSVVAPDEEGDYVFFDSYKVKNVGHIGVAVVSKSKGEWRYKIDGSYKIGSGGRLAKGMVSVSKLFEIISCIEEKTLVLSRLRLSFGRGKKYRGIVSLPVKITSMSDVAYNEISGVRFIKREGNAIEYDVVLDADPNGVLHETISWHGSRDIKEAMIGDMIREGMEISDRFVVKGKE